LGQFLRNCRQIAEQATAHRRITEIGFALLLLERLGIVLPKPMRMTKLDLPAVALSA
jgi:hypothetical protein